MPRRRSWTDEELIAAVKTCKSYAAVIKQIGLVPAGGNYLQVQTRVIELELDTSHFLGMGWNKGGNAPWHPPLPLDELLVEHSIRQSHQVKLRLFTEGLKQPQCELCGWNQMSADGRIPVELDHINAVHSDNRLENLRILCPNCHSLQLTHRGRNKRVALKRARVVELVYTHHLK